MTHRALELLALDTPSFLLDIGCGSGLSGEILSSIPVSEGGPHTWIGLDISSSMLGVALTRDVEGDLFLADAGQGIPFRPGSFDGAISISAVQWLCSAEGDEAPTTRLNRFFSTLYAALKRGARAVCQFYPRDDAQKRMVSQAAIKAGFGAGLLEDDPETKSAKTYLVLTVGDAGVGGDITGVVKGFEGVDVMDNRAKRRGREEVRKGSKKWIIKKKEQMERKGKVVKPTTKYTGRKRRDAW